MCAFVYAPEGMRVRVRVRMYIEVCVLRGAYGGARACLAGFLARGHSNSRPRRCRCCSSLRAAQAHQFVGGPCWRRMQAEHEQDEEQQQEQQQEQEQDEEQEQEQEQEQEEDGRVKGASETCCAS